MAPDQKATDPQDTDDAENTVDAVVEPEVVNSRKALWARLAERGLRGGVHRVLPPRQPRLAADPLETIRLSAEGTFEYQALLFLPSHAPMDLFMRDSKRGVQLYVKRVFIMDDCEALVPEYLRFVKGVVDANDLSLNISREILQQDRQIQLIRKRLVKKVLSTVKTMLEKEPEKYATFWSEFGRAVKEGLLSDHDNQKAILEICSFASTHDAGEADHADRVRRADAGGPGLASTTPPASPGRRWRTRRTWRPSAPRATRCCSSPTRSTRSGSTRCRRSRTSRCVSIARGEVDLGGDDVDEDTKKGFDRLTSLDGDDPGR